MLLLIMSWVWPPPNLLLLHAYWFPSFVHNLTLGGDDKEDHGNNLGIEGGKLHHSCSLMSRKITRIALSLGGRGGGSASPGSRWSLCCFDGRRHDSQTLRLPFLRTLSMLGKWLLADVLVICIIAMLRLDW